MKRQLHTGEVIYIYPFRMATQIDGVWGDWECEIFNDNKGTSKCYLEGDGHLFHWETLKDEDGKTIINYPYSDNFKPCIPLKDQKVSIVIGPVREFDENGIELKYADSLRTSTVIKILGTTSIVK